MTTAQSSSNTSAAANPHLPRELEKEIFELSAKTSLQARFSLVRVARRVFEWIEPVIFHTIDLGGNIGNKKGVFSDETLSALVSSKGIDFFRTHVRMFRTASLMNCRYPTPYQQENLHMFLKTFSGITELRLWTESDNKAAIELVLTLPQLTRLSLFDGETFFEMLGTQDDNPLLDRLTHLQLRTFYGKTIIPSKQLRSVTHFALAIDELSTMDLVEAARFFNGLEESKDIPQLSMLVVMVANNVDIDDVFDLFPMFGVSLEKVIVVQEPDFIDGPHALGGIPTDFWSYARKERLYGPDPF